MKDYKNKGRDTTEMRGRRHENTVELRKDKRTEQLLKRRNVTEAAGVEPRITSPLGQSNVANRPATTLANLPAIIQGVTSADRAQQLVSTTQCRILLSKEKNPPIDEVVEANLVPFFIQFLTYDDSPQLQFEAAWTLTNIASGTSDQTQLVVDAGAVPLLIKLLMSPAEDVREQAVWTLGNIAGDGSELRDLVIGAGILPPLLYLLQPAVSKLTMLRNATWAVSNLCRGKSPQPDFEYVKAAIPTLAHLLLSQDEEIVTDATWALSYLTDGENYKIQAVLDSGVVPRLIQLLQSDKATIVTPTLRTIGNIVTGSDSQTQAVLDCGALQGFLVLLEHPKEAIRKETCWTISNITAGNHAQIQCVLDANIIPALLNCLRIGDVRTKKEAVWAVCNLTSGGSVPQIQYVVSQGCIKPLVDILQIPDAKVMIVALDALTCILKVGVTRDGRNPCADWIDEAGGVERIEQLQNHENEEIYKKSLYIIEQYFSEEDDEDAGAQQQGQGFAFAAPVASAFTF